MLNTKCAAIGHCLDAFPLLIEEAKKQGRTVRDTLPDEIDAKQNEFSTARMGITQKLLRRFTKVEDFTECNNDLANWHTVIYNFLKEIFSSPLPAGSEDLTGKQNLEADLADARRRIDQLEDQLRSTIEAVGAMQKDIARLTAENEANKKTIEELKKSN